MHKFTVDIEKDGQRLDAFLVENSIDLSRSQAQKIVKDGLVRVNSSIVSKPALKLRNGDKIIFSIPVRESTLQPVEMNFDVLYEDADILAINKPCGLVVHPTPLNVGQSNTLAHGLLAYLGENILQVGNPLRPGIVHRLDKDTSGVILVAKTTKAYLKLIEMFAKREIKKTYLSLVHGVPEHKKATIDAPLDKFFAGRKMVLSQFRSGKKAITHYVLKKVFQLDHRAKASLLEIDLETGRTHQIRVHFASIGHPVIGDQTYGLKKVNQLFEEECGLKRQFLHAAELKFIHPCTKKELIIQAPLLADLQAVLKQLTSVKF